MVKIVERLAQTLKGFLAALYRTSKGGQGVS